MFAASFALVWLPFPIVYLFHQLTRRRYRTPIDANRKRADQTTSRPRRGNNSCGGTDPPHQKPGPLARAQVSVRPALTTALETEITRRERSLLPGNVSRSAREQQPGDPRRSQRSGQSKRHAIHPISAPSRRANIFPNYRPSRYYRRCRFDASIPRLYPKVNFLLSAGCFCALLPGRIWCLSGASGFKSERASIQAFYGGFRTACLLWISI